MTDKLSTFVAISEQCAHHPICDQCETVVHCSKHGCIPAIKQDDFKERLAQAIEKMPFGDTAASFAAFVREFK
jgi:hypothetical protein